MISRKGLWLLGFLTIAGPQVRSEPWALVFGPITMTITGNTNPAVIRREILFQEGQPFEYRLADESQRRIQSLPYVKKCRLVATTLEGRVQVLFAVEDKFSWDFVPSSSGGGGNVTITARLTESNFLGQGMAFSTDYAYNTFKQHYGSMGLSNPYLLPDGIGGRAQWGLGQDGYILGGTLWRSPRWAGEEWTFEVGGTFQRDTIRVFDNGLVTGIYTSDQIMAPVRMGRAWVDDHTYYGLSVGTRFEQSKYLSSAQFPILPPTDRTRLVLLADASVTTENRVKDAFFNGLGEEEEVTIGSRSSIGWEHASVGILSDLDFHTVRISQGQDYRLGKWGYMFLNIGLEGRVETRDLSNLSTAIQGRLALRTLPVGFFVGRMLIDAYLKNENRSQLLLGSDTGLRGYAVNRFAGEKRMLFNLEQRALIIHSPILDVGSVLFVDMGHVFKESELMNPQKLNTAVGMGFRVSSRQFGWPMARLDVGYGLTDSLWAIAFGTGQYF